MAVRDALNVTGTNEDSSLETYITAGCRAIDYYCGQFFYDTGTASERWFPANGFDRAKVDPFHTTVPIVATDSEADGTWGTTWTVADYELGLFGGDMGPMMSAPWDTIYAVGSYAFPQCTRRRLVLQVTAQWGWAAIPPTVVAAAELISKDLWRLRATSNGVTLTDFGPLRLSADVVKRLQGLLGPFRRMDRVSGIA